MYTVFCFSNLEGRNLFEDLDVDVIIWKYVGKVWTRCVCLRI